MEKQYIKMLQSTTNGRLFPYTEVLAQRPDMVPVDVEVGTDRVLLGQKATQQGSEVYVTPEYDKNKPGPGWYKNNRGSWSRRKNNVTKQQ
jgi:hypothetical protein